MVFLSVQLATAAYACANGIEELTRQVQTGMDAMDAMPGCAEMAGHDTAQDNDHKASALCMGHCQADTKHADHAAPQMPAFVPYLAGIVVEPPVPEMTAMLGADGVAQPRAPPPPHAILHCCLRT